MNSKIQISLINTDLPFQILDIFLSANGVIEPGDLSPISLPENIDFSKGVIINGKAPVWLYAHLVHLLHISAWVATFDPRLGGVVVQSHSNKSYQLGDVIPLDIILPYLRKPSSHSKNKADKSSGNKIVAFVGPPHSGKSVFLHSLVNEMRMYFSSQKFVNDLFVIRACPDGEGDWFNEISNQVSTTIREKKIFDADFTNKMAENIISLSKSKSLLLIDCGGKIDRFNQLILNECTHAIIISKSEADIPIWKGALESSEVETLLIINSKPFQIAKRNGDNEFTLGELKRNSPITIPKEILELIC